MKSRKKLLHRHLFHRIKIPVMIPFLFKWLMEPWTEQQTLLFCRLPECDEKGKGARSLKNGRGRFEPWPLQSRTFRKKLTTKNSFPWYLDVPVVVFLNLLMRNNGSESNRKINSNTYRHLTLKDILFQPLERITNWKLISLPTHYHSTTSASVFSSLLMLLSLWSPSPTQL